MNGELVTFIERETHRVVIPVVMPRRKAVPVIEDFVPVVLIRGRPPIEGDPIPLAATA